MRPPAGLCDACAHQKLVRTGARLGRSRCACATGPSPSATRSTRALPVRACRGLRASGDSPGGRSAPGSSGPAPAAGSRPGTGCRRVSASMRRVLGRLAIVSAVGVFGDSVACERHLELRQQVARPVEDGARLAVSARVARRGRPCSSSCRCWAAAAATTIVDVLEVAERVQRQLERLAPAAGGRAFDGLPPGPRPFGPRPLSMYSSPSPSRNSSVAAQRAVTRDAEPGRSQTSSGPRCGPPTSWSPPSSLYWRPTWAAISCGAVDHPSSVSGFHADQFFGQRCGAGLARCGAEQQRGQRGHAQRARRRARRTGTPKRAAERRRRRARRDGRPRRWLHGRPRRRARRARGALAPPRRRPRPAGGRGRRDQIAGHVASSRTSISGLRRPSTVEQRASRRRRTARRPTSARRPRARCPRGSERRCCRRPRTPGRAGRPPAGACRVAERRRVRVAVHHAAAASGS